jgi:hypothetical protein
MTIIRKTPTRKLSKAPRSSVVMVRSSSLQRTQGASSFDIMLHPRSIRPDGPRACSSHKKKKRKKSDILSSPTVSAPPRRPPFHHVGTSSTSGCVCTSATAICIRMSPTDRGVGDPCRLHHGGKRMVSG